MIDFENYKSNLDVTNRNCLENVDVNKKIIYKGKLDGVNKIENEAKESIQPLAAAVIGLNNTAITPQGISNTCDIWTEHDAQECYLNSKPSCYLIVGKPGTGSYSLGEAISKKYNCVHLCPEKILIDEIEQGGLTGKCIKFNMQHKKIIKGDTVLNIMKSKLESAVVKHRGYIVSGFPLVTCNNSLQYLTSTLYSEEALDVADEISYDIIANLKKNKRNKLKTDSNTSVISDINVQEAEEEIEEEQEEENVEEETEEQAVELPKYLLDPCSKIILSNKSQLYTNKIILLKQLKEIFDQDLHPDIIIYLTCSDKDLVTKKNHKYYNYKNDLCIFNQFIVNMESELRWPTKCALNDYVAPYDIHKFNPKYCCKHPINFKSNSINQICNYKQYILPFIEDKLKDFDPKHIIRLDAHCSIHEMIHQFAEIFVSLSIKPIIIPEPLYLEDPPEEMEDFWNLVQRTNAIKSGVLTFYRYPSLWYNRCPVELQKRKSSRGLAKFSVSFFKHVYVLSSLEAFISFCKNPRPYLKLNLLEPTCRIIVLGTKSSGKTMISECLSWIFDAPIISYKRFIQHEKQKKYVTYSKSILSEIIPTIEDARLIVWKNTESERLDNLNKWLINISNLLKAYVPILVKFLEFTKHKLPREQEDSEELLKKYGNIRKSISFLPFLDDVNQCLRVLQDKSLVQFAPIDLVTVTKKPDTPILGDADVNEAIHNYIIVNELQREIQPTNEELMTELKKILLKIDEETKQKDNCYGKYIIDGFTSDPESWSYLSEANLLPDNTIAIIENRKINSDLFKIYNGVENCIKNHQERFTLANDPLIKTKLRTTSLRNTSHLDVQIIIQDYLNILLNSIIIEENIELDGDNPEIDFVANFTSSVENFREDWDNIKLKLEENFKSFIDVELENKSDIEIVEEVLLKLRKSYFLGGEINDDNLPELVVEEDEQPKDMITSNDPRYLCETNIYCPITFYKYGVLWDGKPELCFKYNNKMHYFSKEEGLELFQKDITLYQGYNKPFKHLPPLRLCVVGCIGSGKSTISKLIAKELGLIHINFSKVINDYLIPQHFKKVGRQYENCFTDAPLDEEGVVEFQIDEENVNYLDDILSNETEIRRMVYNYFERGTPIMPVLMQKLLKKLWFESPFKESGFVLDGYPRLPSDIEDMVACYCIPDLIIELECNLEISLQRLSQKMYKTWKSQLSEAKEIAKKKLDVEKQVWMDFITKNVVVKLILEDILSYVIPTIDEEVNIMSAGSAIIEPDPQKSLNVENNLFNIYNEMIHEHPAPIDRNEWEKHDEARERIDARIERVFEVEDDVLRSMKDIALEQNIKFLSIDGTNTLNKVTRLLLSKLSNIRNQTISFFEQTFIITNDIAEILLSKGFYFFSKFERMCPVYIYENPQIISNPFKIIKRRNKLFPVIHRCYIYFIFGEENLKKFRKDPLKYITRVSFHLLKEYPLRISVIGSPKSGKSRLAHDLAKRYGSLCITRGKALRYILNNQYWTELSSRIKNALHEGHCIKSDDIMKAVQIVAIDHRTITYGLIFDGFPETASEAMELIDAGLYPTFIIDISNNIKKSLDNSQNEIYYDILKRKPPYSAPFIEYRYSEWSKKSYNVRNWINNDIQNLYLFDGNQSKWQCLKNIVDNIEKIILKIHYYLINVKNNVVPAHVMCISDDVFRKRMSPFNNLCPLCLQMKILKHSGYPVDKEGVVQYKNKFYWICSEHMHLVLKYPGYLLMDKVDIPEIPAIVKTVNLSTVYENGICIVTYAQNLPSQKIVTGDSKYAATYRGKTYLFCRLDCLNIFISKPHMYCDIVVFSHKKLFPQLPLNSLPNIGYLEQTFANIITDACCAVNVVRPKYPGLSIKVSALLYIALYLKIHNPHINKTVLPLFEKIAKAYEAKCKLLTDIGLRLRSMDNPFAKYPKCCRNKIKCVDSGTVRKPSSFISDTNSSSTMIKY